MKAFKNLCSAAGMAYGLRLDFARSIVKYLAARDIKTKDFANTVDIELKIMNKIIAAEYDAEIGMMGKVFWYIERPSPAKFWTSPTATAVIGEWKSEKNPKKTKKGKRK